MKKMFSLVLMFLVVLGTGIGTSEVGAQPYPNRPIQLFTPGTAGTMHDITCRIFAEEIGKILKNEVVVLNKPGASMTLGVDAVVRAKKDGYTILYASATPTVIAPIANPKIVPYNPLKDIEPLGGWALFPLTVTVQEGAPWKTFGELIEYAKKNPGKLRVGTPEGLATLDNFNVEIVQAVTGAKFTQVPISPGHPTTALLGEHIEVVFSPIGYIVPQIEAKKFRLLLLTAKLDKFPAVPTLAELGYKAELLSGWFAFFAPAGIPEEAKGVLVAGIEKAFKSPEVKTKLEKIEYFPQYKSPAEFKKILAEAHEKVIPIAEKLGLRK